MKQHLRTLSAIALILFAQNSSAQCITGTAAQINWDNLDYYYVATTAPYGNGSGVSYVTSTHAATQKFAIGKNSLTFSVGANITIGGENATHTGDGGSYGTGQDIQFTTTANAATITMTFATEVNNLQFSIFDLDNDQRVNVGAVNAASTNLNVTLTKANATSGIAFVPVSGIGINPRADGISGDYIVSNNQGTVNVTVAGPVKTVTISLSNVVGDFWISDINACVTGTWTTNYHQIPATKPFTGQPDYFITTPDNNSVYMLDPATGRAYWLFTDPSNTYVNSFGYDPVNHILYYVTDGSPSNPRNNKALKKYDFNTETISTVMTDINATLNIPTFDQGVESAAAAFYDGYLFIGIEGGRFGSGSTRESIIYRLTLDAGGVPTEASQVFALDAYNASSNVSFHDWGDFLVKDGNIIDFNTARQGSGPVTYPNSAYHHFDMMTGALTTYTNPTPANQYAGQGGLTWYGQAYTIRNTVAPYNLNGTLGTAIAITSTGGPAWVGNAGDASEPFRPKMDFGDAPATYDPAAGDPAVHEMNSNLRLGATFDREWVKTGATSLANADGGDEDGLPYVNIFNPAYGNYLTQVNVFNNSGANATVCAWLDYNGNGVFNVSEGITVTVPSSASTQSVYLYWPSTPSSLPNNSYTYLRIRIAPAASGMTTSNPTGYYSAGEVEDYRVTVNSYPLTVQLKKFDAQLSASSTVISKWSVTDETDVALYAVEKSRDRVNWELVNPVAANNSDEYSSSDQNAFNGTSYYRLRILGKDGKIQFSDIRRIENTGKGLKVSVLPNPVVSKGSVLITSFEKRQPATIQLYDAKGGLIRKEDIIIEQGATNYELPVSKMSTGSYTVRIQTSTQTITKTIVVK